MTLSPIDDAICFVNNSKIRQTHRLTQGKYIIIYLENKTFFFLISIINVYWNLGDFLIVGNSIFRYNNPEEAIKLREEKELQMQNTSSINNSICNLNMKSQSMPSLAKLNLLNESIKNEKISLDLYALDKQ